jgi:hypothetical protein
VVGGEVPVALYFYMDGGDAFVDKEVEEVRKSVRV